MPRSSLIIPYLNLPRRFGVFCDVNSTFYGPRPLKDGRGTGRRIFSGIHCRCHTYKAPPPVKKGRILLAATPFGELSQFLLLYIKMQCVSSWTFCSIYHMRFGLLCGGANFVTSLYLRERCLTTFCHSHFLLFLSPPASTFSTPSIDYHTSSPCRHGKTSFESSVLSPCLSTSSCQPHQR